MQALPNTGRNTLLTANGTALLYNIEFEQAGLYFVYVRGQGPGTSATERSGNDSIHVGLNGVPVTTQNGSGLTGYSVSPGFQWASISNTNQPTVIDVPTPGTHTFWMWMREDGTVIDKVLLSTTPLALDAADLGPSESARIAIDCPTAGAAGRIEQAIEMNGSTLLQVAHDASIDFAGSESFSLQMWLRPAEDAPQRPTVLLSKRSSSTTGYQLVQQPAGDGALVLHIGGQSLSAPALPGGVWSHVAAVIDRTSNTLALYINGEEARTAALTEQSVSVFDTADLELGWSSQQPGSGFVGQLDEMQLFRAALTATDIQALYQSADQVWYPTVLGQPDADSSTTPWSVDVPANREGLYQMNVRATDEAGNRAFSNSLWRGLIDTLAPRVSLEARPTGITYFNTEQQALQYETEFTCAAEDLSLSESGFVCPCNDQREPERGYVEATWWTKLFSDTQRLNRLSSSCTVWLPASDEPVSVTAQACDDQNPALCSTDTVTLQLPNEPAPNDLAQFAPQINTAAQLATDPLPKAVVASPVQGDVLASDDGTVAVVVNAESEQPLQRVELLLNGAVVDTITFDAAQNVTNNRRTVIVTPTGEGTHTVAARATDSTGTTQEPLFPISFVLDTQPPQITLDTDVISTTSQFVTGNGVVAVKGTAADTVGLDTVQVQIGDRPFTDATVEGNTWRTLVYLDEMPDGVILTGTVRVRDQAGRVATLNKQVTIDLMPPAPVDLRISYRNGDGATVPLAAGSTISDTTAPLLVMEWDGSSDGSGLLPVLA
ncbi:MAG: LamG domain-containing protein, partial [Chloroflexaceae bacterium]|nr:LamG domain-containing protein [Chloroflexaceae bacterium]